MIRPLSVAILALQPFMFSACCTKAQPRFWEVRDGAGKSRSYTVDTITVPANSLQPRDVRYVDPDGHYVEVGTPKVVREMSEQEWKLATSGAGYSLYFCGHRKGCWAKTKDR